VSAADVRNIAFTATVTLLAMILMARPLLFASLDPEVARARGTPVRLLSYAFLILLALAVAQAVQVVGVLLIFSLLVAPAAAAQRLTSRIGRGMALSVLLALLVAWGGLIAAYFSPYPAGFFITSFAFAAYLLARLAQNFIGRLTRSGATSGIISAAVAGATIAQGAHE
jgi:zinc/manganese transport system permease protein